ncbi:DnaJ-domain-containing protein, partial [Saccharata proteae CBS 121410]
FHTSTRSNAAAATHYETLQLPTSATPADIKRQFYALSKLHHPDRNKSDPSASQRFVLISEAYHVLGSPDRRARYDREHIHTAARHHPHPSGSHSSHAGSRPASG